MADKRENAIAGTDVMSAERNHDGETGERRRVTGRNFGPRRGSLSHAQRQVPPRLRKVMQATQTLATSSESLEETRNKVATVDQAIRAAAKPSSPMAGVPKDAPPLTAPQSEIAAFVNSRGEVSALKSMPTDQKALYTSFREGGFIPPHVDDWDALLTDQMEGGSGNVEDAKASGSAEADEGQANKESPEPKSARVQAGTADLSAMYGKQLTPAHLKAWLRYPTLATPDALSVVSALARVRKARARINGRIVAARTFLETSAAPAGSSDAPRTKHDAADGTSADHETTVGDSNEDEGSGNDQRDSPQTNSEGVTQTTASEPAITSNMNLKGGTGRMLQKEVHILRSSIVQVRETRSEIKAKLETMIALLDSAEENALGRLQALGAKAPIARKSGQDSRHRISAPGNPKPTAPRKGGGPRRPYNAGFRSNARAPRKSEKQQQQQQQQSGDLHRGNENQSDSPAHQVDQSQNS